jgi:tetratricopeptide (TPR) repeat protein
VSSRGPGALALAAVLAAAPATWAGPIEDRFAAAANLIAEDRDAEAARQLEALAREAPDHPLAPEALFSAAEVYEDRLAEPGRALALYQELGKRYPDSRRALAASRRASSLAAQVGPGPEGLEAQGRFLEIRQGAAQRPEAESIAMAEALLREHPDWVGAPAVALWLGGLDERAGRFDSAMRRYLDAAGRYREPEARFDALRSAGDLALRLGRFDDAERAYRRLDPRGDTARRISIDEALAAVERTRTRARWYMACAIVAGAGFLALLASLLLAAGSPRAALRALWPPPSEVLYLVPIGIFLSAVSYTDYQGLGPAVTLVSTGGVVAAWLSGAGLILRAEARSRRAFALAHALCAGVAVLALLYIAMYATELLDPMLDTLRYGPEP